MGAACKLKNAVLVLMVLTCGSVANSQIPASTNAGKSPNTLTCSPAPCVLPNVQVANLTYGALPRALVINPNNENEMVLSTTDGNCGSGEGFYSARDGGSTWPGHSCIGSNNPSGA